MTGGPFRRRLAATAMACALPALTAAGCSSPAEPAPTPDAPSLTCPSDVTVQSRDGNGLVQTYQVPVASGGSAPVAVACVPPSGSTFVPGSTPVTCTATDNLARRASCSFMVRITTPPRLKYTKFMAFGDSMTAGKPGTLEALEDWAGSYPTVLLTELAVRYTAQSFTMSKQGISGESTQAGLARLPATLATEKPEVVMLMEGANDLFGGDQYAVAPAVNNMVQMVSICRSAGDVVFLATLPPQRAGLKRAGGAGLVPTYNAALASQGSAAGATIVDLYKALSTDVTTYISDDGLHPTTAGYQKIADTFFASIQASLQTSAGTSLTGASAPLRVIR